MAGPAAQLDEAKRFAEIVAILQKHQKSHLIKLRFLMEKNLMLIL